MKSLPAESGRDSLMTPPYSVGFCITMSIGSA